MKWSELDRCPTVILYTVYMYTVCAVLSENLRILQIHVCAYMCACVHVCVCVCVCLHVCVCVAQCFWEFPESTVLSRDHFEDPEKALPFLEIYYGTSSVYYQSSMVDF